MALRKWILSLFFFLSLSESAGAAAQYAFRVTFTDKAGSPPLSNPLVFLSQRSLDRRANQGISLSPSDQPVSPDYLDSVLTITQGTLHVTSRWLNSCVLLLEDSSKILLLNGKPYISDIKLVGFYAGGLHRPAGEPGPSDEHQSPAKSTADPDYYGSTWNQTHFLHGECLHDLGWLGQGRLIAVLDDGFNFVNTGPAFENLYQSGRIKDTYNFIDADPGVFGFGSHGTHVLSTMAGYIPDIYVGAAPFADYALYITEEQSSEQPVEMDQMIAAFERADSIGADIISSSLGYDVFFGMAGYTIPASERDGKTTPAAVAANMAAEKGMLVVITMGNEGSGGILTPGDADSALTVGNMDMSKTPAGNSGYGPNAAGVVKPDVCAMGQPGSVMAHVAAPFNVSGTSIATPQIAGFAACLWQAVPGRSASEIKSAIVRSADRYNNPLMPQHGYGVPDFCTAFHLLGIRQAERSLNAAVYPNPFAEHFTINFMARGAGWATILVSDLTGKIVYSAQHRMRSGSNMLDVRLPGVLSAGVYLCKIVTEEGVSSLRLLKN